MGLDEHALPLTRGQLDIWLSLQIHDWATDWHLGWFVVIEGPVEPSLVEQAVRQVVREAEPVRAAVFEVDGQVFQKVVDDPDVEVADYDLRQSHDPVREAYRLASSIRRTPMPLAGPLFKFALFQTRVMARVWVLRVSGAQQGSTTRRQNGNRRHGACHAGDYLRPFQYYCGSANTVSEPPNSV